VRGAEYELAVHIAVAAGLRRGEICALEWDDIDLGTGIIAVRRAIAQTKDSGEVVKLPKNNREREVYAPVSLVRILRSAQARQQRDRETWGPSYVTSNRVVRHADGSPYTPCALSGAINRAIKSAGLNTTLKNLRDAYISMGFAGGGDDKAVQLSAGHHTPEFTREKYQHVYDPMKKALADIIEEGVYGDDTTTPSLQQH
jgi:ATP-dependent helicase/nuclease subunit A